MSVDLQPFVNRIPKRTRIGQYWAVMGYLFGLVREIDPKLRYTIDTFTLIGLLFTLKTFGSLGCTAFNGFRVHVWSRICKLDLKKRYGQWAVITGATDGIGLEYARQLAARGHSLILVGRNQSKLEKVREELLNKLLDKQIVLIQADLADAKLETYKRIESEINSIERDVGILINNAGVMYKSPNRLLQQTDEDDYNQITVNCTGLTLMTRTCLPGMVKRKRGLIINLSSVAGYRPLPLMGVYSASKKYVEYFSKSLQTEYKAFNIDVQVLTPSYISTKMTKWSDTLQKPSFVFPDAKTFVSSAIATIGRSNDTTGFWSHGLQVFFYEWFVPDWLYTWSSSRFLTTLDSTTKGQ